MTDQPDGRADEAPGREPVPEAGEPPDGAPARVPPPPPAWPAPAPAAAAVTTRTGSWFAGLDPRGWRTTIAVAVLMVATVVTANLVNAAVPLPAEPSSPVEPGPAIPGTEPAPGDPTPVEPVEPAEPVAPGPVEPGDAVEVGYGLVLYPPAGWSVVGSEPGQVALQKGGVVLLALAIPYDGDPATLAEEYTAAFFADGQFTAAAPQAGTLGNGVPSVVIGWSGIVDGSQYDGAVAAGVASGTGMVLNVIAPKGQFGGVASDLDVIGDTLQIVPGGG